MKLSEGSGVREIIRGMGMMVVDSVEQKVGR